ncbi:hypothetical protein CRYUN_Cryun22dG0049800 [Craigia yunnanensis]
MAGGSSSGSAAVVSAGLCPVALGVDGGGSVRMPASLCSVVGFKPTFGCIPHSGVLPLNWTVGMVGIVAGTLEDAFIAYAAISGQLPSHEPTTLPIVDKIFDVENWTISFQCSSSELDSGDGWNSSRHLRGCIYCANMLLLVANFHHMSQPLYLIFMSQSKFGQLLFLFFPLAHGYFHPKVYFPLLNSTNSISNIKFAKYEEWFNDCSDEIRICCSNALNLLCEHYKWKTVEVTIPEIEAMRRAHYVTIGTECSASLSSHLEKLDFAELGWDTRAVLKIYGAFHSKEYIKAQKMRNRHMQIHNNILAKADVIVAPTTRYYIMEVDHVVIISVALIRYQIAGNFLGLPAVTIPVQTFYNSSL